MPSLDDIVQVAESLEKSPVAVIEDRCVSVRNRNSTCRKCVHICQTQAIEVSANEIHLDASLCMACGACTSVCPTEALVPLKPTDAELSRAAAKAASMLEGHAVFACARISSKHLADPSLYAEVPCLARMEESILLSLVAHGANRVTLVDGVCDTCKYRSCVPSINDTVTFVNELIEAQGGNVRVERVSEFPQVLLADDTRGLFGSTRRGFFADAAGAAKETAMAAARTTIEQELGYKPKKESIGSRLRVTESGTMPQLEMPRHDVTINAMDAIGFPVVERIESRRFASVSIDATKCNACGMCAMFCPTGALKRDETDDVSSDIKQLEFTACECVQCGLCRDVCWKGALSVSSEVPTDQLFDFDPVVFDLRKANRPKMIGLGRR